MKVAMFQQAPYRFLPEDFEQHYVVLRHDAVPRLADAEGITTTDPRHARRAPARCAVGLRRRRRSPSTARRRTTSRRTPGSRRRCWSTRCARRASTPRSSCSAGRWARPASRCRSPRSTRCSTSSRAGGSSRASRSGCPTTRTSTRASPASRRAGASSEGYEVLPRRAWAAQEPFAFNGRYSQYANVNIWPRPVQDPHPPLWFPGSGNPAHDGVRPRPGRRVRPATWFGVKMGGRGHLRALLGDVRGEGQGGQPAPRGGRAGLRGRRDRRARRGGVRPVAREGLPARASAPSRRTCSSSPATCPTRACRACCARPPTPASSPGSTA